MFGTNVAVVIAWLLALSAFSVASTGMFPSVAWADDDDDGGDDDDGSPSSQGAGGNRVGAGSVDSPCDITRSIRGLFGGQLARRPCDPGAQRQAAPQPAARPDFAPNEIVTRGLTDDQTAQLVARGYVVLERADLASLGTTVRRFQVPDGVSPREARDAIRAMPNGETADFNHFYRTGQDSAAVAQAPGSLSACDGLHCPARELIDWPVGLGGAGCGAPVTIGMVDTGLNIDHEVLTGADIDLERLAPEDYSASAAVHGTAVASILVGDPGSRVPGLLPGLPLVAVDAFHIAAGDERADAFTLVRALDRLSTRGVKVINLSLSGPPNAVLEDTLLHLTGQRGIPVIAAAGNDGPQADPAYPAAYDNVIAVTAVDPGGRVYRRANRGAFVDLAAPGVEVWAAASISGARWMTGTSFAAPYVTAAVALWRQADPTLTPQDIRARMTASADDLGPEGFDETYGQGLLDLGGVCPGLPVLTPASAE